MMLGEKEKVARPRWRLQPRPQAPAPAIPIPHTANDLGRDSVEDIYNAFSPECTLRNSDVESSNSTLYSLSP